MKLFKQIISESDASEEAKKQGLVHKGWGKYADKSGKIVAKSEDGKLVKIKSKNTFDEINGNILQKLSKYNIKPIQKIGEGTRGKAYLLKNGNVLKITSDISEAKSMIRIKKYNLKNVVKPIRIFKKQEGAKYYIEMEKLEKIPENIHNDKSFETSLGFITDSINEIDIKNINDVIKNKDKIYYANDFFSKNDMKKHYNNFLRSAKKYPKFTNDYINGLSELKNIGIEFNDSHFDNIMMDDKKNYKFIDIGYSHGAEKEKIKTLKENIEKSLSETVTPYQLHRNEYVMVTGLGVMYVDDIDTEGGRNPLNRYAVHVVSEPGTTKDAQWIGTEKIERVKDRNKDYEAPVDQEMLQWSHNTHKYFNEEKINMVNTDLRLTSIMNKLFESSHIEILTGQLEEWFNTFYSKAKEYDVTNDEIYKVRKNIREILDILKKYE